MRTLDAGEVRFNCRGWREGNCLPWCRIHRDIVCKTSSAETRGLDVASMFWSEYLIIVNRRRCGGADGSAASLIYNT
jgi:hypothetical protein